MSRVRSQDAKAILVHDLISEPRDKTSATHNRLSWTLAILTVGFLAAIPILEATKVVSDSNRGLSFVTGNELYLWKYGPTLGKLLTEDYIVNLLIPIT